MLTERQVQLPAQAALIIAILLWASPVILNYIGVRTDATMAAIVAGIVGGALATAYVVEPARWSAIATILIGIITVASPFALGFSHLGRVLASLIILGVGLTAAGIAMLLFAQRILKKRSASAKTGRAVTNGGQ